MLAYQDQTHPKFAQEGSTIVGCSALLNYRQVPAAQYVRMSTEHQCYSTQNQMDAIAYYARSHGMVVVRTFSDEGKSGITLDGRPGLLSLLDVVQSGLAEFRAILVYDVSRWGRFQDADESGYWEYLCRRAGVAIHYCAEPFLNDGSLSSVLFKSLKRTMAGEYSRELSAKVFAGQCRLIGLGYRQGGPEGFGFRRMLLDGENQPQGILSRGQKKWLQTGRVVLVPGPQEEQRIIQEIYRTFIETGKGQTEIAHELNACGIATGTRRPWTYALVHEILINPKYTGANVFNRTSFKLKQRLVQNPETLWVRKDGAFPAIVTSERFLQAANILERRRRGPTDEEMLDHLRLLRATKGRLTRRLIDEREGEMPASASYIRRFGGLRGAYARIGYIPKRDYSYIDARCALKERRTQCFNAISSQLIENGAAVSVNRAASTMRVNGEFTLCLILARCQTGSNCPSQTRPPLWRVRVPSMPNCDLTVIARMNETNSGILDYYLFPKEAQSRNGLILQMKNSCKLDMYRFDNLDYLYQICRRKRVGVSA